MTADDESAVIFLTIKLCDADGLQKEFDRYVKTTIRYVIDHVLEKYVNSLKKQVRCDPVEHPEYLRSDKSYMMPDFEISEETLIQDVRILEGISLLGKKHRLVIELGFLRIFRMTP